MRCLALLVIISMICAKFQIYVCFIDHVDRDRRFKEEVIDFVEYLKQKLEKKPHSHLKASAEDSFGEKDARYLYKREYGKKRNFEEKLELNNPNDKLQNYVESLSSSETVSKAEEPIKQDHGVEEMVYFRRSESDTNDPVPEIIEKLINDQPIRSIRKRPRIVRRHADVDSSNTILSAADDTNSASSSNDGACPIRDFVSHLDHTCTDGPEYEMEFHPEFSETLKHRMEDMLPESNHGGDSKCGIGRLLGPKTGVEDRALCPFNRSISTRNPSRMPEYLYEARCACQVWIDESSGQRLNCTEVKRAVPVLWLVSCNDGKKRYKQGWDEIAVACVPIEVRMSASVDNREFH